MLETITTTLMFRATRLALVLDELETALSDYRETGRLPEGYQELTLKKLQRKDASLIYLHENSSLSEAELGEIQKRLETLKEFFLSKTLDTSSEPYLDAIRNEVIRLWLEGRTVAGLNRASKKTTDN